MYVPKMILIAVALYIVWSAASRVLNCQSSIGRALAPRGMLVGCRKREDGGEWTCDLCSIYGGTADIVLLGAAVVCGTIGIWQWIKG
ncbi:MAG TPA: hypothetical protein VFU48_15510 [Nitrospira sp.]|nr:hypothetical protein [Nitrospira sp.]